MTWGARNKEEVRLVHRNYHDSRFGSHYDTSKYFLLELGGFQVDGDKEGRPAICDQFFKMVKNKNYRQTKRPLVVISLSEMAFDKIQHTSIW